MMRTSGLALLVILTVPVYPRATHAAPLGQVRHAGPKRHGRGMPDPATVLKLSPGWHAATLPVHWPGRLAGRPDHLALIAVYNGHGELLPVDPRNSRIGPAAASDERVDEPRLSRREAVAAGDGWLIATNENFGQFSFVNFWRADRTGRITRVVPAGETPAPPSAPGTGTTVRPSEHVTDAALLFLTQGAPDSPAVFGIRTEHRKNPADDGALAVGFLGADGHVVRPPVIAHDPFVPSDPPMEAVAVASGFLLAAAGREDTGPGDGRKITDTIRTARISPEGAVAPADRWSYEVTNWGRGRIADLRLARGDGMAYCVYSSGSGVFAARLDDTGKRVGEPICVIAAKDNEASGAAVLDAAMVNGRLRIVVSDPVRLIEFRTGREQTDRVLLTCGRAVNPFSARLAGDALWLVWSRGDWPPPYLSKITR